MLLKKLVIGSCVESIVYAFLNDCFFLPTAPFNPLFFQEISLNFLGNPRKDFVWSRLQTIMALDGRLLNYNNINNIRIFGNNVSITTQSNQTKHKFEICKIFDPTGIELENEIESYGETVYLVYDDFELANLGGKHGYLQPKITSSPFAGNIHYYVSNRVDGANYITDCVATSELTREQLNNFDYSDAMVRFAVERHLTSIGIYGNFMEYYKNGNPKYRKPKVIHRTRLIKEREKTIYKDSGRVQFLDLSLESIFNEISTPRA